MATKLMKFNITKAQSTVWKLLEKTISSDKVGSAYLFSGPAGAGKEAMAIEFGATINGQNSESEYIRFKSLQHELFKLILPLPAGKAQKQSASALDSLTKAEIDIINNNIELKNKDPFHKIVLPNATRIRIDSIRELRRTLYLKSNDIGRKIVIIFDAHLLAVGQAEAANALLKILEEPPNNTTLILVTDNKEQLLPTILSRCQQIDFPPISKDIIIEALEQIMIDSTSAELIAELAQGNMHVARSISKNSIDDLLELIQKLSNSVITDNGKLWREFINHNSQSIRYDYSQFQYNIFLLQIWFKSVYHLRFGVADSLHRPELLKKMNEFNELYPKADFQKIDQSLEYALGAVRKNLYMSLILTNLLIDIRKNFN